MGISLGLVGLGAFGRCFAELFKAHPLVDRIALCDREPERMATFADNPSWKDKLRPHDLYPSLDAICRSDLDALVIITQHWLHAPQCVQAMLAGKHVYSAVPLVTLPDGRCACPTRADRRPQVRKALSRDRRESNPVQGRARHLQCPLHPSGE